MDYRSIIDHSLKSLRKKAQISQYFDSIIFEPRGDGRSFNMLYFVPSMNESVQFGVLSIDKNFINFLKSGFVPRTAWGVDKAYWYFKEGFLTISDKINPKAYDTVSGNLKTLLTNDKQKINNYLMTGFDSLEIPVTPDLKHRMRNSEMNAFIDAYQKYLQQSVGRSSEPIPRLAKRKPKTTISFRDVQEK